MRGLSIGSDDTLTVLIALSLSLSHTKATRSLSRRQTVRERRAPCGRERDGVFVGGRDSLFVGERDSLLVGERDSFFVEILT